MKKVLLALIVITTISCGNPNDISIFETLSVEGKEELKEEFTDINSDWFDNFKELKILNKEIENKYRHITYGDVLEYNDF
tara:strand:+ start:10538 stop:10777 length:240 start_codon:yes stop_codon:yes gene_type:complete